MSPAWQAELPLIGGGGEPVDLRRTINSHGLTTLPPMRPVDDERALEITLALPRGRPRTVTVSALRPGRARITVRGRAPSGAGASAVVAAVRHVLALDRDLSAFYEEAREDPDLAWACAGAGRMIRSQTVFEDVVKTICTTNCAWSATERMVAALVEHLGERAPGAPPAGPHGRAFPTAAAMAGAGEDFYRDVVPGRVPRALAPGPGRSGRRAARWTSRPWARPPARRSPTRSSRRHCSRFPGVGPYAAAHVMLLLGRCSRLILDSWTRPTYARLVRRPSVSDRAIERRFRRYGPWAGLAFWLALTRRWVPE